MTEPLVDSPTLNDAQRDGIRSLREAAYELAWKIETDLQGIEWSLENTAPTAGLVHAGVALRGIVARADLEGLIAWADSELKRATDHHTHALRRLLDDATALLRWVDGAL